MNTVRKPEAVVRVRTFAFFGWMTLVSVCFGSSDQASGAELRALIRDPSLDEISGVTRSPQHSGQFWVHNDSGTEPVLYRLDSTGHVLARSRIALATARDWEDLASFTVNGESGLLIADTGDNGGVREDSSLLAVREPAGEASETPLPIAWELHIRWPDGPRDVEALAVDSERREILLLSKKQVPAELWSLPLPAWNSTAVQNQTPRRIALLNGIEQPSSAMPSTATPTGRYRAQITAADIDPSGHWLAVLTYQRIYLYERRDGENWADAVQTAPRRIDFGWLPQAEALCFDTHERAIWVTSERLPAPLLRLPF